MLLTLIAVLIPRLGLIRVNSTDRALIDLRQSMH
jgi:hypothetical protein